MLTLFHDGGGFAMTVITLLFIALLIAAWKAPCMGAAKEMAQLHKETSGRNLFGWKEASCEHGIVWTNWRDPLGNSGSIRAYDQGGIPVFFLINPEGIIEKIQLGYHDGLLHKLTECLVSE